MAIQKETKPEGADRPWEKYDLKTKDQEKIERAKRLIENSATLKEFKQHIPSAKEMDVILEKATQGGIVKPKQTNLPKVITSIRLDNDVREWLRTKRFWQTYLNDMLRRMMLEGKHPE